MEQNTPVQKRIEQIDLTEKENKEARSILREALEDDPIYLEAVSEAKEAIAKRNKIKKELMAKIDNQKVQIKIKENNEELSTLKEILSVELVKLHHEKQTDEVEDQFGEPRKFKLIAKLLPRKKRYDERDNEGRFAKDGEVIPEGTLMRELPDLEQE
jgi:hypothetical protein